jgi:putative sterol carrier protein
MSHQLDDLTQRLRAFISQKGAFEGSLRIDMGADGNILIDGGRLPPVVTNDGSGAECTIKISKDAFEDMMEGKLDPTTAYMKGMLQIIGDIKIVMGLGPFLGDG